MRTEEALGQLIRQVGGLSERVGGDLEDTACIVLHEVLNRELGWQVEPLEGVWQTWEMSQRRSMCLVGRGTHLDRSG